MAEKRKPDKTDDPKQSERFEKTARKVDAADDEKAFERAIQSVVLSSTAKKPKQSQPKTA